MIPLPPAPPGAFCAPLPPTPCKLRALPLHHPLSNSPHKKILRRITTIRRRNYFLFGYGIPAKILSNGP